MQLYLHNYAEILAAAVCTFFFIKKPTLSNRWFLGFLWLTVAVELSAKLMSNHVYVKIMMYNIFSIIEVLFYLFYLRMFSSSTKQSSILRYFAFFFLLFGLGNLVFFQGVKVYNQYTSILGDELISIVCLMIFYDVINGRGQASVFKPLLLIVTGLFLFYTGSFLLDTFYYLNKKNSNFFISFYRNLNGYLNVLMYISFSLAFVWERYASNPETYPPDGYLRYEQSQ